MSTQHATQAVGGSPADVRRLLLDPLALPSWNPAFHSVDGPPQPRPGSGTRSGSGPASPGRWSTPESVAIASTSHGECPVSRRWAHGRSSRLAPEHSCIIDSSTPAPWHRLYAGRTAESPPFVFSASHARSTRPSREASAEPSSQSPATRRIGGSAPASQMNPTYAPRRRIRPVMPTPAAVASQAERCSSVYACCAASICRGACATAHRRDSRCTAKTVHPPPSSSLRWMSSVRSSCSTRSRWAGLPAS